MAELPLSEQVAVITGASQGIGRAVGEELSRMGARVMLAARNVSRLAEVAAGLKRAGGVAEFCATDLRSQQQVTALIETTLRRFERVDILVNNAGIGHFGTPLHLTPPEVWDATWETNLRGIYFALRAVVPTMIERRGGHIINIASLAAHNPLPGAAIYAASKAALHQLSVSVAEELRGYGIRVSLVCPGSVDTDLSPELVGNKDRGKMLRPEDVAHVVAMLVTQGPRSFVSEVQMRPTQKP